MKLDITEKYPINATYNYWGTTDQQAINQTIYDFKNDYNLGSVAFVPFLDLPNSQSPSPMASSSPAPATPEVTPSVALGTVLAATVLLIGLMKIKRARSDFRKQS